MRCFRCDRLMVEHEDSYVCLKCEDRVLKYESLLDRMEKLEDRVKQLEM